MEHMTTIVRTLAALALATGLTAAGGAVGVVATHASDVQPPPRTTWMRTPCQEEDSLDCAWNAHVLGNGHGTSFYAVRVKLLGKDGHRLGVVGCHYLVDTARRPHMSRFDSCQVLHRANR
jgi:hypothetical protein